MKNPFLNFNCGSNIVSFTQTASKKIEAFIPFMKFVLHFISKNLLYVRVWNSVALSGLELVVATWLYWAGYRNGCVELSHISCCFWNVANLNLFHEYCFGRC